MPNHVINVLRSDAKVFGKLVRGLTDAEIAEAREDHLRMIQSWEERNPEAPERPDWFPEEPDLNQRVVDFALLIPEPPNIEKGGCSGTHDPGVICWYSWNITNWGTKWNGYRLVGPTVLEDGRLEYRFETAWSHPYPVIKALSEAFPQSLIEVEYADEDFGSNVGRYAIIEGMEVERPGDGEFSGAPEGREIAARLWYDKSAAEVEAEWAAEELEWEQSSEAAQRPGPHGPSEENPEQCTCGWGEDLTKHLSLVEYYAKNASKEVAE